MADLQDQKEEIQVARTIVPVVVVIGVLFAALGLCFLFIPWNDSGRSDFVKVVGQLAWPAVVVLGVAIFYNSISRLLDRVVEKSSRISIGGFKVEIADARPAPPTVADDLRTLHETTVATEIPESSSKILDSLTASGRIDYLIIDLGNGDQWLTSRLYFATTMLELLRGLRCVVFVETRDGALGRFVGLAESRALQRCFARRWPWLELAFGRSYASAYYSHPNDPVDTISTQVRDGAVAPEALRRMFKQYLAELQTTPLPQVDFTWVSFTGRNGQVVWERAKWITTDVLRLTLEEHLSFSQVVQKEDSKDSDLSLEVFRKNARFVAILKEDGTLDRVVDRRELAVRAVERSAK